MIKNSSLRLVFTESRRGWKYGNANVDEWAYEGGRKRLALVATDGEPSLLTKRSAYYVQCREACLSNSGGTAGIIVLSRMGQAFSFFGGIYVFTC